MSDIRPTPQATNLQRSESSFSLSFEDGDGDASTPLEAELTKLCSLVDEKDRQVLAADWTREHTSSLIPVSLSSYFLVFPVS